MRFHGSVSAKPGKLEEQVLTTIARAPSIYRHPTFCVATSQASPVSLAAAVHENRGRMIKPRIDVTIAPREKLGGLRAFSEPDTRGTHKQHRDTHKTERAVRR